jgi:crotonobetainyl-CoA:carnitine CoA-transferase CaiB-like acyl-CoA transferase
MAALFHRQRTGEGQKVEVPMFEAFSHFMLSEHLGGQSFDPPNGPVGYARQLDPDRQPFPTSDGHISIVPYTLQAWDTIFELLGAPEFLADPRFADTKGRVTHQAALYQELAQLTAQFTTADLLERFAKAQVPAQAVRDLGEMLDDPHLQAVGFFNRREHPSEGAYVELRQPVTFSARPHAEHLPPQRLGESPDADWGG